MAKSGKRVLGKLSARAVATAKAGRHSDGGGLYIDVSADGRRRWVFFFNHGLTASGKVKRVELGLGSARDVSLAEARERAEAARRQVRDGINPLEVRRATDGAANPVTFGQAADAFLEAFSSGWRNEKHRDQWSMTLATYAEPLRARRVDEIGTEEVLSVLQPIWKAKAETASRLRGRIERVLDFAKVKGWRSGENPARWRGHLDKLLAKRERLQRGHHAAMPFENVPAFMVQLREAGGVSALALEFTILTAARSGEVLNAEWSEFDLERAVWTVPARRMKAGREHRVPLAARALRILETVRPLSAGRFVFLGQGRGRPSAAPGKASADRPLSVMAMTMVLRRMKREDVTVHGFRSAFRDWAAECTPFANEVCEAALAHVIGNKAEAAYRRGDLFEKRRLLMEAWASYCEGPREGVVISMRREA